MGRPPGNAWARGKPRDGQCHRDQTADGLRETVSSGKGEKSGVRAHNATGNESRQVNPGWSKAK